jgi:hypothetical protein
MDTIQAMGQRAAWWTVADLKTDESWIYRLDAAQAAALRPRPCWPVSAAAMSRASRCWTTGGRISTSAPPSQ